ncbi:MAG: Maf family protein [Planctomycetota bacterium]
MDVDNLVLASGSPRRKRLLHEAGYQFTVLVADDAVEESVPKHLSAADFVIEAATRKGEFVAQNLDNGIVLAADTVAVCDGKILGKPKNREHAREILQQLSGTTHRVLTGIFMLNCTTKAHVTHLESTELQMEVLDSLTLQEYLNSDKWIGKAGAFGYQDGIEWVSILNGLESNVVGLPVEVLPELFKKMGQI